MATIDEECLDTISEPAPPPVSDNSRSDRRQRVREALTAQRSQLDQLENELSDRLQHLLDEISRQQQEAEAAAPDAVSAARAGEVDDLIRQLNEVQQELAARQSCLEIAQAEHQQARVETLRLEQELRIRETLLQEAQVHHERRRAEWATLHEDLADALAQHKAARERQDQLRRALADERERTLVGSEPIEVVRARIADELRAQYAGQLAELERCQAELRALLAARDAQPQPVVPNDAEVNEARRQVAELRVALDQRNQELDEVRGRASQLDADMNQLRESHARLNASHEQLSASHSQLSESHAQLSESNSRLNESNAQLNESIAQLTQSNAELNESHAQLREAHAAALAAAEANVAVLPPAPVDNGVIEALSRERDQLAEALAAAELRLEEMTRNLEKASKHEDSDNRKVVDLQRRLELTLEDFRELKRENGELEAKLAKARNNNAPAAAPSGGLDWESQKQRLLASLEADDDDDEKAVAERATIEGTIRVTEQVIAEKDQEIAELKRQLDEVAANQGTGSMAAAAAAEVLDHDELIRQEREKLLQAQAEWREKIGKAEIDISVERAKIARDRLELEEKIRLYQAEHDSRGEDESGEGGRPSRGRWLARLGLKDDETPS